MVPGNPALVLGNLHVLGSGKIDKFTIVDSSLHVIGTEGMLVKNGSTVAGKNASVGKNGGGVPVAGTGGILVDSSSTVAGNNALVSSGVHVMGTGEMLVTGGGTVAGNNASVIGINLHVLGINGMIV